MFLSYSHYLIGVSYFGVPNPSLYQGSGACPEQWPLADLGAPETAYVNTRILHLGSKAQDKGDSRIHGW